MPYSYDMTAFRSTPPTRSNYGYFSEDLYFQIISSTASSAKLQSTFFSLTDTHPLQLRLMDSFTIQRT